MKTETFEARISWWKWGIAVTAGVLMLAYAIYFGWHLGQKPAMDAEKWGQFGDFIGGLLNPLVAFAAFYWLTQSVKIQREEFANTRMELVEANRNARSTLEVSALNTLISSENQREKDLNFYIEKHRELMLSPKSTIFNSQQLIDELGEFRREQNESREKLKKYRERLEILLLEHIGIAPR